MIDSLYWSHYINAVFIPQIDAFENCLINKVLVSFDNIAEESEKMAEKEYDRLGNMPAGDIDFMDMSEVAEKALDKAITYYSTMNKMKDGIIALFTSGLYHLFEQQIFAFYRKAILPPDERNNISLLNWSELKERFKDKGLNLDTLKSFERIEILQLISNVIKHAEGKSAKKLRKYKPAYFKRDGSILGLGKPFYIYINPLQPLAGEDVKIPLDDFLQYCEDVKGYWQELNEKLGTLKVREDT